MDVSRHARLERPGHAVTGVRSRAGGGMKPATRVGYDYAHAIIALALTAIGQLALLAGIIFTRPADPVYERPTESHWTDDMVGVWLFCSVLAGISPARPTYFGTMSARVVAELQSVGELEELRDEWQALEGRLEESPYLRFEWLRAWARVYEPQRLAVVRVREGPDIVAAGLLEVGPRGALRFAGRPATSDCRLLCSSEMETSAWGAFVRLLRRRPWRSFEARGLSRKAASALPEGWALPLAWLGLRLAPSFDEYLSERSAGTRRGLKGKVRRAAREGIEARPVPDGDRSDALHDFIRLHQLRATSKGQQHPAVDDRLCRMLDDLGGDLRPRLFELIADRRRIGVTVRVDTDHAAYFYNAGIDPHWGHVSPGILMQLASIRDAIEAGLPRYDLGPGDFRYKRDLGGVLLERYQVAIEGRGLRLRLGRSGTAVVGRLRHSFPSRGV